MSRNRAMSCPTAPQGGFSLVELMISLVLGLLIVGGAITVFVSNRQAFVATENLSRMQETGRVAFELLGRDLREAGGGPCQSDRPVRNLLNAPTSAWWTNWDATSATSLIGYAAATAFPDDAFGTAPGARIDGTAAIEIKGITSRGVVVDAQGPNPNTPTETNAALTVNTAAHGLAAGDIAMVCNFDGSAIFQITAVAGAVLSHAQSGTPGNASADLSTVSTRRNLLAAEGTGVKVTCRDQEITEFVAPDTAAPPRCGGRWIASIAKYNAVRWFVANSGRSRSDGSESRSLYRQSVVTNAGSAALDLIEVVDNVTAMDIFYLQRNETQYVDASATGLDFAAVIAVRVVLTVESPEAISAGGARATRQMQQTITLRSRPI